jgi:cyanophycinase-like exopeptidase
MSLFDVRLHVLSHGDAYDLEERIPIKASARDQEAQRGRGEGKPEGGRA